MKRARCVEVVCKVVAYGAAVAWSVAGLVYGGIGACVNIFPFINMQCFGFPCDECMGGLVGRDAPSEAGNAEERSDGSEVMT